MTTVNTDPYPDAPGESGSIANIAKLLGVGAYTIDDSSQGSGLNFGQDVGTETFVKSLIYSVAMGMGTGDGTITSALNNLGTYLQTMPLDSLKLLQPYVPNTTADDFATVEGAVEKTLAMFQMGSGALNVDDFNNWVETLLDPWTSLLDMVRQGWDQLLDIFQNNVTVPINAGIQAIKDWWVDFSTNNPLWNQLVTWWNQILSALGISTGAGAGTAVGGQIYTAGATANSAQTQATTQNAWWGRITTDLEIFFDLLHQKYPAGSVSDTKTTTIGGLRTWYSAIADMLDLLGIVHSVAAPAVVINDVGTFATNTQTQVVTNEGTLSTVQAAVDALTSNDPALAGKKYVVPANGGAGASWGSDWATTATNANIAPKSSLDVFDLTLASSSSVDLRLQGRYANVTLTDDQVVSLVFFSAAGNMGGSFGPTNTLKGRMDAAGNNYVYARVNFTKIELGYATGGTEQTPWATATGLSIPAGAKVELYLGSSAGHRNYQVVVNGVVVLTYAETGTSSQLGASYRGGGQDMLASHGAFNDVWGPAKIRQFILRDSNVSAVTYGSSARWYRNSTSAVNATRNNVITGITTSYLDTTDYASPDINLLPGGITFDTPGRYRISFAVRFNGAQTGGMAPALLRTTSSGTTIEAEGQNYGSANMLGLEGSFEFNAIGDGAATEAWFVGMDMPGTSGTYNVVGNGGGYVTWVTVTRIA
jgi:hypothetical protein